MNRNKILLGLTLLSISFLFSTCTELTAEEVGRLPINAISQEGDMKPQETTIDLKKGDLIAFWADMDMEYEGGVNLLYHVDISEGGKIIRVIEVDPRDKNVTVDETKVQFFEKMDWSFKGKNAEYEIPKDGPYTFSGFFIAAGNDDLILNKAEIVLKKEK